MKEWTKEALWRKCRDWHHGSSLDNGLNPRNGVAEDE